MHRIAKKMTIGDKVWDGMIDMFIAVCIIQLNVVSIAESSIASLGQLVMEGSFTVGLGLNLLGEHKVPHAQCSNVHDETEW